MGTWNDEIFPDHQNTGKTLALGLRVSRVEADLKRGKGKFRNPHLGVLISIWLFWPHLGRNLER